MDRTARSRRLIVAGALATLIAAAATFYLATQPTIRTATLEEVKAVIPADLLQPIRHDADAEKRFDAYVDASQKMPAAEPAYKGLDLATGTWHDHRQDLERLRTLVESGPMEIPSHDYRPHGMVTPDYFDPFLSQLTEAASAFAILGRLHEATDGFLYDVAVSDRLCATRCDAIQHEQALIAQWHLYVAILKMVCSPKYPAAEARRLLSGFPPAPPGDVVLAYAAVKNFQENFLPFLPDPFKQLGRQSAWGATIGNYDAIATARECGEIFDAAYNGVQAPFSRMNVAPFRRLVADWRVLPKLPSPFASAVSAGGLTTKPAGASNGAVGLFWDRMAYRKAMNRIPNSLGKKILQATDAGEGIYLSGRTRALRQSLRAVVAIRIYMSEHGGTPPTSLEALSPTYIGTTPLDPYTGKSLLYNPAKQVVYSVGANLVDDGGDIKGRDFGYSFASN